MTNRSHGKDGGVLQWLFDQGEERLSQITDDLAKNKAFTDALGKALKQAARTKGRIDQNVQTVLSLLNVPSKADYTKLVTKLDTLQGSLVNVSVKLDRVLAALNKGAEPKPQRKARSRA